MKMRRVQEESKEKMPLKLKRYAHKVYAGIFDTGEYVHIVQCADGTRLCSLRLPTHWAVTSLAAGLKRWSNPKVPTHWAVTSLAAGLNRWSKTNVPTHWAVTSLVAGLKRWSNPKVPTHWAVTSLAAGLNRWSKTKVPLTGQ